jgi:hypothetical protein
MGVGKGRRGTFEKLTIIHHIMHTRFRKDGHLPRRQHRISIDRPILRTHMCLHTPLYHHHDIGGVWMDMRGEHSARSKVQLCNGLLLVHENGPGAHVGGQDGAGFEGLGGLLCEVEDELGVGRRVPEVEVGECHFQPRAEVWVDGSVDGENGWEGEENGAEEGEEEGYQHC